MTDIINEETIENLPTEEELEAELARKKAFEYAELAAKANNEGKVIFTNKDGEYDLIDQLTFNTCDYENGEWIVNDDKKASYEAEIKALTVPQSLSRFQAVRVLKSFKIGDSNLYKLTDNYIKSLDTDIDENDEIVDAWELAQEFRRDSNTILAAQKKFELTDDQVDQMFIDGAKITA